MGSDLTSPADRPPTSRVDDYTFQAFLHDVHHAYLLLHRAFQIIPPTIVPDLELMPRPGLEELNQPEHMAPLTLSSPAPSPTASEVRALSAEKEEEDNEIFRLVADQDLPHRVATAKVPPPVRRVSAPDLPAPGLSQPPPSAPPKAPRRRTRTPGPKIDKTPTTRKRSRSRSVSTMSTRRPWTSTESQELRRLKEDKKAKYSWRTIAGKLARSERDCKLKWNLLTGKLACK